VATKHTLFRASRSQTKAESTTIVAKGLIEKETAARDAKTSRLRAARLEHEAFAPKAETPATKRKPSTRKRTEP